LAAIFMTSHAKECLPALFFYARIDALAWWTTRHAKVLRDCSRSFIKRWRRNSHLDLSVHADGLDGGGPSAPTLARPFVFSFGRQGLYRSAATDAMSCDASGVVTPF
jgi:phage terminase large subunit GpA-like protein